MYLKRLIFQYLIDVKNLNYPSILWFINSLNWTNEILSSVFSSSPVQSNIFSRFVLFLSPKLIRSSLSKIRYFYLMWHFYLHAFLTIMFQNYLFNFCTMLCLYSKSKSSAKRTGSILDEKQTNALLNATHNAKNKDDVEIIKVYIAIVLTLLF
jgi:hypothetical protein